MKKTFLILIIISLFILFIGCKKTSTIDDNKPNNDNTVIDDQNENNDDKEKDKNIIESEEKTVMARKSFKILSIGNNATDDILTHVYDILNSYGVQKIVVANMFISGADINTHITAAASDSPTYSYKKNTKGAFDVSNGMKLSTILKDEDWDIITLNTDLGKSGLASSYDSKINALVEYIKNATNNDKTVFAWNMTWAFAKSASSQSFNNYNKDQLEMYNAIVDNTKQKLLNNKLFYKIIPIATAIQNARTSYLAETLTKDGEYLEELGQFIAGLTLVTSLTNWDIDDLNYDLIPQRYIPYLDIIKDAINNANKDPFNITESTYKTDPLKNNESVTYKRTSNITYSDISSSCKLDMYLPDLDDYDVVVHFHGGGITGGSKDDGAHIMIGQTIASGGVGFVSANYRLYPQAKYPDFIVDAANAVKYVYDYMKDNNINGKLYVSGQSAGAYIAMMLCLNNSFLNDAGMSVMDVDGWLIEAGQPTTHFNVLAEDGLDSQLQRIDEKAPMYYVSPSTKFKKMLLITYTNDMACRLAQTTLLKDAIKNYNPNARIDFRIYQGNHCVNSTTAYRNYIIHAKIILDYIKNNK